MSKHRTNEEVAARIEAELERLSRAEGTQLDEHKRFAAAAEAARATFSTGTVVRFGQTTTTPTMVYFKRENAGTFGSPWPTWAYELAKLALLHGRKLMVYSNGDPLGTNLLYVYVTDTIV